MSRLISEILGAGEPHFTHTLMEWERRSGHPSHDVRLITDIRNRRQNAMNELGLDSRDTTARELYFALRERALSDSEEFMREIKIKPEDDPQKMAETVVAYVEALEYPRDLLVVKQSFIKSILKTNSPKKLMKLLGLRSIDSVIKRANINEFLALAYAVENEAWLTKLHNSYKKLRAGDLQSGVSTLFVISSKNWEKLHASEHKTQVLVRPVPEIGAILITPARQRFPGDSLSLVLAVIEALSELRMYSAYFRHISVQNDLGLKFSDALHQGLPSLPASGYAVSWRDFQRYLSGDEELFDEIRQPHFQMEDLHAPSGIETLAKHFDQIKFWKPLEGVFHDDPELAISCHLIDVLAAAANDKEPEHVPLDYMRAKLWEDLGSKYLSEKHLQSEILKNIV